MNNTTPASQLHSTLTEGPTVQQCYNIWMLSANGEILGQKAAEVLRRAFYSGAFSIFTLLIDYLTKLPQAQAEELLTALRAEFVQFGERLIEQEEKLQ